MTSIFTPTVVLGKHHREAEAHGDEGPVEVNTHEMRPQKRARGSGAMNGILEAVRSTGRKPVARIPKTETSDKPKEAGRGAERLVTLDAPGIYHQSLLGTSFQQGWAKDAPDGLPIWGEGKRK